MTPERVILTDCDGVLCNWDKGFNSFAQSKGFSMSPETEHHYSITSRFNVSFQKAAQLVEEFNSSTGISNLEPMADAVEYVHRLSEDGFKFIVVTAVGDGELSKLYRAANLQALFGSAISELYCLPVGTNKGIALGHWSESGYFWLEDHIQQAEAGYAQGLRPILFSKPFNRIFSTPLFPRVSEETPWKDLYKIVSGAYNSGHTHSVGSLPGY